MTNVTLLDAQKEWAIGGCLTRADLTNTRTKWVHKCWLSQSAGGSAIADFIDDNESIDQLAARLIDE